ncbi:hypothetical protein WGT02_28140 (plasmid) [Rhizobium sp. T1470]|uniref:hypothetical protein n=1 Tax=unclassified Rhizobium TaxID=2613769 RepID=UPI001AAECD89|nr:hypothetical protein [Rhizobium sp. T1473]MCA0805211.1 hypothetical protein [Rhizobium sp. T1473]
MTIVRRPGIFAGERLVPRAILANMGVTIREIAELIAGYVDHPIALLKPHMGIIATLARHPLERPVVPLPEKSGEQQ